MGIEPFLVASAISGVVGQRLLRRICHACSEEVEPTQAEVALMDAHVGKQPEAWKRGKGCNLCSGTGYRGRVGVYELLEINDEIREMVVSKATHHEIRRASLEQGMRSMQQQAFDLVLAGETTLEDVVRSVYAPGMELQVDASTPIDGKLDDMGDIETPSGTSRRETLGANGGSDPLASDDDVRAAGSVGASGKSAAARVGIEGKP
jgi:type IV pilus assembly protein PilB